MGAGLREHLQPVGAMEELLVDRIVAAMWRLRRVHGVEAQLFQENRNGLPVSAAECFARDSNNANAFTKLARYDGAIERGLFRALHELERLQIKRTGENSSGTITLDVTAGG